MSQKRTKKFDCVAYKHRVQARIYEETKHLSPQEEITYFHKRASTGPLGSWWTTVQPQSIPTKPRKVAGR